MYIRIFVKLIAIAFKNFYYYILLYKLKKIEIININFCNLILHNIFFDVKGQRVQLLQSKYTMVDT